MAKPQQIDDPDLRALVERAANALRGGDPATTVRTCAEAYQRYLGGHPALERFAKQGGRLSPLNWPRLGTQIALAPQPAITFTRERFAFSEAATVYEFTVDSIVAGQQFASP